MEELGGNTKQGSAEVLRRTICKELGVLELATLGLGVKSLGDGLDLGNDLGVVDGLAEETRGDLLGLFHAALHG